MKRSKSLGLAFVGSAIVLLCSGSEGALNAYMSVTGQKSGLIKGGVRQKGREGKIMVIAMNHEIVSPRDVATGQATGKHQYRPLTATVEWDEATPRLYAALMANELLSNVTIEFYAPNTIGTAAGAAGVEVNHMTIKLTNANIATIQSRMLNNKNPELARYKEYAEISFVYQKIEILHPPTGLSASGSPSGFGLLALVEPPKPLPAMAGRISLE